jgi:integrase
MTKTKPVGGRETMRADPKQSHLFVRTHPSGIKSYVFRYRKKGHAYKTALGPVDVLELEDARKTVRIYVGEIARDINPIAKRKKEAEDRRAEVEKIRHAKIEAAQKDVFTVNAMIQAWAASRAKIDNRSPRYVKSIRTTLKTTLEPVLDLPARDLHKEQVEKLIAAAESRGPAAAAFAQSAINMAFRRAIRTGKLEINPCAALEPPALSPRERLLTTTEIGRIWRAAEKLPRPLDAYVRFLMATGVRRNEALYARWSEIEGDLWHIPKERMKAKRPFTVPLAYAALRSLPARGEGFVFSRTDGATAFGGMTRLKTALDAAIEADGAGPLAPWTFHHLRHALVTWLCDHEVDYVIANLCLAHGIPLDRSGKTYQRSYKIAERRQALDMWSNLLDPEPEPVRKGRRTTLRVVA